MFRTAQQTNAQKIFTFPIFFSVFFLLSHPKLTRMRTRERIFMNLTRMVKITGWKAVNNAIEMVHSAVNFNYYAPQKSKKRREKKMRKINRNSRNQSSHMNNWATDLPVNWRDIVFCVPVMIYYSMRTAYTHKMLMNGLKWNKKKKAITILKNFIKCAQCSALTHKGIIMLNFSVNFHVFLFICWVHKNWKRCSTGLTLYYKSTMNLSINFGSCYLLQILNVWLQLALYLCLCSVFCSVAIFSHHKHIHCPISLASTVVCTLFFG